MVSGMLQDTSLVSTQSAIRNADILAQYLDTEELEQMSMIFDNIRSMRSAHVDFAETNDDAELQDLFDEALGGMIADLTDNLNQYETEAERTKATIAGKRELMSFLLDKTLEYQRVVDPQAEIVLTDLAT